MRCTIVAPTRLLMSPPTIGTPAASNLAAHSGVDAMTTGMAWSNATPASRQAPAQGVAAEGDVHEARHLLGGIGVAVVLEALHEAARAVADAGDGEADGHWVLSSWLMTGPSARRCSRSAPIRPSSQAISCSMVCVSC